MQGSIDTQKNWHPKQPIVSVTVSETGRSGTVQDCSPPATMKIKIHGHVVQALVDTGLMIDAMDYSLHRNVLQEATPVLTPNHMTIYTLDGSESPIFGSTKTNFGV